MSSDSQRKFKKVDARGTQSPKPKGQLKKGPPSTMATNNGVRTAAQRQNKKKVAGSGTNSTTASPSHSGSATAPPQTRPHFFLTHRAPQGKLGILLEELQTNCPKVNQKANGSPEYEQWFNDYDGLDNRLLRKYSKSEPSDPLGHLKILFPEKNGTQHSVSLQAAVRDTISYLLDVEAKWNPITAIPNVPQGTSKALWPEKGRLWLGGIKDSGNVEGILKPKRISAVVSIHPTDWLTDEIWKGLFQKWDGETNTTSFQSELKESKRQSKRMQYHIGLTDESNSDLLSYFQKAFWFMDYYLERGMNVLVHCKMGQSRSASLVVGYMMHRYYKTQHADLMKKSSKDRFEELEGVLKKFPNSFALQSKESTGTASGTTTGKRKGVSTKKFEGQLRQYAHHLARGEKIQPFLQLNPAENKAGGGIIKDAAMVFFFLFNFDLTKEVVDYWSERRDRNTHYWLAASKAKALKQNIQVKDPLAAFNGFFESQLKARPQGTPVAQKKLSDP